MQNNNNTKKLPLVIGVCIFDITMTMDTMPTTMDGAMYHGRSAQTAGGVGRNLTEVLLKLYGDVNFISLIGDDPIGNVLLKLMPEKLWENIERETKYRTSLCTVMIDKNGDCKLIAGDLEIHQHFTEHYIRRRFQLLNLASLVIIDGNLPIETMTYILKEAQRLRLPVFYEPTDLRIAGNPFRELKPEYAQQIRLISPNYAELQHIFNAQYAADAEYKPFIGQPDFMNICSILKEVKVMLSAIASRFDCIVVTLGQHGVVLCLNSLIDPYQESLFRQHQYILNTFEIDKQPKRIIFFPTLHIVKDVVNVSGAGDSFAGGFISGLLKEFTVTQSVAFGFMAARRALQTVGAVPQEYFPAGADDFNILDFPMDDYKIPGKAKEIVL